MLRIHYAVKTCFAFLGLAVGMVAAGLAGAQTYTVTDLGTLGGLPIYGLGLNASGKATGYGASSTGFWHSFLWTPSSSNSATGTIQDLGVPNKYAASRGYGINGTTQIAGVLISSSNGSTWNHAALWSGGRWYDLGVLGGGGNSIAYGINDTGQVVGISYTSWYGRQHAFLWTPTKANGTSGNMKDLGTLGGLDSGAAAINKSSQVAGWANTSAGVDHAFVWKSGTMLDLGALSSAANSSYAQGINSTGQIVGYSVDAATGLNHAFLWTPAVANGMTGTMIDLGTLLTGKSAVANAVDSAGRVVGGSDVDLGGGDYHIRAFLWDPMNQMHNLNDMIADSSWVLIQAIGINDKGQIVGIGNHNGEDRAFLLTPQ